MLETFSPSNIDFTPQPTVVTDNLQDYVYGLAEKASRSSKILANSSVGQRNQALLHTAQALSEHCSTLLKLNAEDVAQSRQNGLSDALVERMELTSARIETMVEGLRQVAALPDPIGQMNDFHTMANGMQIGKMRVPLGVIAIIYESRPGVTAEAAALSIKSGNSVVLRGGSECLDSNLAIGHCLHYGLEKAGLPRDSVTQILTKDRQAINILVGLKDLVDVVVPRGGKGLVQSIEDHAKVPVIYHLDGICHAYVAADADPAMANAIVLNAKTQRYATCNTLETLLVDTQIAATFIPAISARLRENGVELRACELTCKTFPQLNFVAADEQDWFTEYLAPILSIRMVDGLAMAVEHINHYGSHHTDTIITSSYDHAWTFLKQVDSSSVMVNASTRLADGFEYGLGAEIGISTSKIHARGPVGLEGLTSEKFVVFGNGQLRE